MEVVGFDVATYGLTGLADVLIAREVSLLILEAAEPALNHYVVSPAALAVHALLDVLILQEASILFTCNIMEL